MHPVLFELKIVGIYAYTIIAILGIVSAVVLAIKKDIQLIEKVPNQIANGVCWLLLAFLVSRVESTVFVIHTYGFFIALGFLAAIFISKREAKLVNEDPEMIADLIFWILVAAILGSRIFYVIVYWKDFYPNRLFDVVKIWEGGLVFYGGFIGASVTAIYYLRKFNMPVWKGADILAPAIPFGHFLGRLGCFSAGCCHGKACHLPWAVTFTNPESLAPLNVPLHPTQIYESMTNLMIFLFIINYKRYKTFDGQVFFTYVIVYAIARAILETFRGDFRGAEIFGILSVSQAVALVLGLLAVGMLVFLWKRGQKSDQI